MGIADIIILALVAVAFVAVCVRIKRKGTCADCAQNGTCSGTCSAAQRKRCPACQDIDLVTDKLARDVDASAASKNA